MRQASGTLKEVVVNSLRPLVEQADDKVIFNVEDDPASKTETAIDILRKTPFVSVDGEENIKVNGKSNFKVLLNGRETSMFARNVKEALRGFPGAMISKIEIITNPSAKYDGEGIGGLINIITKKKVVGYNGTLSTFNRTVDKTYHFSLNTNAKFGKFGASVLYNYGGKEPTRQGNVNTTIATQSDIFTKRTLAGDSRNSANWNFGNIELSYEMDSLNTFSLYSNINSWSNRDVADQIITTEYENASSSLSGYRLDNESKNPGISVGLDYIRKFKKNKEAEFSMKFFGEFGKNDATAISFQDNPGTDRFMANNSHATNNQYTIQADHSTPVNKKGNRLESGIKAIIRDAKSDFESLIKYNLNDKYELNPFNTDKFKYEQQVLSVYGMFNLKLKKGSLRMGTRAEYTNVNGDFITTSTKVKDDYLTILPNILFSSKVSGTTTLTLNYNMRLSRPYIYDLNPFVFNNDSFNISYGNPGLGPQNIHSMSAQLRYGKKNTFAGVTIEGSYSDDKILSYTSFDPQTGITTTTSLNIGKEIQGSLNLNLNTKFTSKWSFFVNGSIRYVSVKNNRNNAQSNSGFGGNFNLSTNYRFNSKFNISSYLGFWREPVNIQTTFPFNTWHNVAFNYKIFRERLNISVRAVNYFEKKHDFKTIIKDQSMYTTRINTQNRRAGVLSLTYNFGKLNESVSKKKGVSNDDLLSTPQAPRVN
jgi:hypothetical protein